jgi:hypothetical protein
MGSRTIRWAAFLAVGALLSSCEKDLGNLGLDLIGAGEFKTGALKSVPVVTTTERYDTLLTSNTGILPVGGFQDPVFGRVDAYSVTQIALGRINPRFGANPKADSVYFFLPVTDWYGDTTAPIQVVVQPLLDPLVADSAYTAADLFDADLPVADTTFVPAFGKTRKFKEVAATKGVLRLALDPEWFTEHFLRMDTAALVSTPEFVKAFPGFRIQSTSSAQSLLALTPIGTDSKLVVYFSNDTTTTKSVRYDLALGDKVKYAFHAEHDFGQAAFDFAAQDTAFGSFRTFTQSLGGATTSIRLSGLAALRDSNYLVNYAELEIPVDQVASTGLRKPKSLTLLVARGEKNFLINDYQGGSPGGALLSLRDSSRVVGVLDQQVYRFNVTRHVQRMLNGKDLQMDRLLLLPSSPNANAQRVVLNGNLHPSEPTRLNLYITRTK